MKKLILLLFISNAHAGLVIHFSRDIKENCPKANILLIKKALLETMRGLEKCQGPYTKDLISKCDQLDCDTYNEIY